MANIRKPVAELKLTGMYTKRSSHKDYADPDMGDTLITEPLECPSHYSVRTKRAWDTVVPSLTRLRVLTEQDMIALQAGFDAFEEMVVAQRKIKQFDRENKGLDESTIKRRLSLNRWMLNSMNEANRMFCRFGLTPTERTKLNIIAEDKKDEDPLSVVLGG